MSTPKALLSAALLLLLCACGPPTSSDPAAMDQEFVLYEPDETLLKQESEDVSAKMIALRSRLNELVLDYDNYDSVATGDTDKTEQRAGGTERMDNLPDRGVNVGTTFDSLTMRNRNLLDGSARVEADGENLAALAYTRISEAKAALVTATAANEWTDEEVKVHRRPIEAAEAALEELNESRQTLRNRLDGGEEYIMEQRESTPGTPNQN